MHVVQESATIAIKWKASIAPHLEKEQVDPVAVIPLRRTIIIPSSRSDSGTFSGARNQHNNSSFRRNARRVVGGYCILRRTTATPFWMFRSIISQMVIPGNYNRSDDAGIYHLWSIEIVLRQRLRAMMRRGWRDGWRWPSIELMF